jgi:hypothetical protein
MKITHEWTRIITALIFFFIGLFLPRKAIGNYDRYAGDSAKIAILEDNPYFIKQLVINKILYKHNSPLINASDIFIDACLKYNLDCYLLPAISGIESTFGKYIYSYSYNPFGWGGGYIIFLDWSDAIETVAKGLKKDYINKGAVDLYQIGRIYAPPSKTWAYKVDFFMKEFYNEELKVRKTMQMF